MHLVKNEKVPEIDQKGYWDQIQMDKCHLCNWDINHEYRNQQQVFQLLDSNNSSLSHRMIPATTKAKKTISLIRMYTVTKIMFMMIEMNLMLPVEQGRRNQNLVVVKDIELIIEET